jgi:lipopolysaccharide export system permease protein
LRVEIHKKYSIPFACVVFALIGAPVGIMARQGGWAIGGGLSLFFFLLYWTFLIGGEGLADRQFISPVVAMWSPNLLVGAFGIYLMIRTVRETTFLPWDRIAEFFRKKQSRGH